MICKLVRNYAYNLIVLRKKQIKANFGISSYFKTDFFFGGSGLEQLRL